MKRGAHKRKLSKEKQENNLDLQSKTAKLTDFFTQVPRPQRQHDIPILNETQSTSSEVETVEQLEKQTLGTCLEACHSCYLYVS